MTRGDGMEHDERADELEQQAERLEHESERLEGEIDRARSDWEAKKSDTQAPGAASAEAAGPHNIESEDPATGRPYGQEERSEEVRAVREEDDGEDSGEGER